MINQVNNLNDQDIYYLAEEIRNDIVKATDQSITDWSGAFAVISEIAVSYLSDYLNWACIPLSDIHPDLTETQAKMILNQAAARLGYV